MSIRRKLFMIFVAICVCLLSGCLLEKSAKEPVTGEIILSDDFEGYESNGQLVEAYKVIGGHEDAKLLSTAVNHTPDGSNSLVLNSTGVFLAKTRVNWDFKKTLTNLSISVWIKSNGANTNERGVFKVRWNQAPPGARDLVLGVWPSEENFRFRDTLADAPWTDSGVSKTPGWHKLTIRITEQGATMLIDDVEIHTNKDFIGASYIEWADEWGTVDQEVKPVYFDDLLIVELL